MSRSPQRRRSLGRALLTALFVVARTAPAAAGTVEVVSRIDPGFASDTPNGASQTYQSGTTSSVLPTVSVDGRYVVFTSKASSLVNGFYDTNNNDDVFLYDKQLGALTLVSHGAAGPATGANGASTYPVISADGRWVAYLSTSTNLVTGQSEGNSAADVFLWDRFSNTSVLVSHTPASATSTGNAFCARPHINDDGSFVGYGSHATNLVTGQTDTASTYDVFLFDRATGANTLVSHAATSATTTGNGHSNGTVLSGDGAWVAFSGFATNLIPGQTDSNSNEDIFLYERATGTLTLISHTAASSITTGSSYSRAPILGLDASWIAYNSASNNLAPGQVDSNFGGTDIFLYERATGINTLVSHVASSATQTGSSSSQAHSMSADGRWIAYSTSSSNMVTGQTDSNFLADVFLYDRTTGAAVLVSHTPASATTAGGNADLPVISRDGSRVAFHGYGTNLVAGQTDSNGVHDTFVWERSSGTVSLASHISPSSTTTGNNYSWEPVIGGDGSSVFYRSTASNLWPKDKNNAYDVFFYDTATGGVTLVSQRASNMAEETPNNTSYLGQTEERVASDDGRWVVFMSSATDLSPGQVDTNGFTDVFLYDRLTRFTTLVSRGSAAANIASNRMSYDPAISADGRWVVFTSTSTNLITGQSDVADTDDVFLYDRLNGTRTLVSHRPGLPATAGSCCSAWPSISGDGNTVSFRGSATNLVTGQTDTNGADDIFLWDRATNTNLLVTHTSASTTTAANGRSWPHVMSADGAWIAYQSEATNLMSPFTDGNGPQSDVYLWDRATNTAILVSHADGLPTQGANAYPGEMSISADGRYLAHNSAATDLVTGQTGNAGQVFLYDRVSGANTLASHVPGSTTQGGNSFSDGPVISADGPVIVFETLATNLGTGITDTNNARDLWVHLRSTNTNVLVSHTSSSTTTTANGASQHPRIDQDGDAIVFQTAATNIAGSDSNGKTDVIFYDRIPRKAWFASRANTSATSAANSDSFAWLGINANGDAALFASFATNLTWLDQNGKQDLFLYSFKPVANLQITNYDGFTTVSPGQSLTWTITVFNAGPEAVTGATVTDNFPASVTGVLWSCTAAGGGSCPSSGSGNINATVNLPVGATVTFTANGILDPAASGTLSNTASVTSTGSVDLDPSDNSATDVDTIQ